MSLLPGLEANDDAGPCQLAGLASDFNLLVPGPDSVSPFQAETGHAFSWHDASVERGSSVTSARF
jgi:hypothetical protein